MPVTSLKYRDRPLVVGDYYLHRRTGQLVEIMEVDLSGNCKVLDVTAPLDGDWEFVTESQMSSCMWERVESSSQAA